MLNSQKLKMKNRKLKKLEKLYIEQYTIFFKNFRKGNFYKINDLKEKSDSGKIGEFVSHRGSFKSLENLKLHNRHKKHAKTNKQKI